MEIASTRQAEMVRYGVLDCQVCVPASMTDEEIVAFAAREYPSGTNGWQIRRQGDGALNGDPERQPCRQRAGCVHVMLDA